MSQALPRARLRGDGGWGCLSLRNTGQERSVSQPGQPLVPHSQPNPGPGRSRAGFAPEHSPGCRAASLPFILP